MTALFFCFGTTVTIGAPSTGQPWKNEVVRFLESNVKTDGGYGWLDQPFGHVTATWAVVGSYQILERPLPRREEVIEFIQDGHPFHGARSRSVAHAGELKCFVYQQIQALQWLGESAEGFREIVDGWGWPSTYPKFYERTGYPLFQQDALGLLAREMLGFHRYETSTQLQTQVAKRARRNGSFNNTAAADQSDGHVVNTLWGVLADAYLSGKPYSSEARVEWLRDCQMSDGGFAAAPRAQSDLGDLYFSWAAVRALEFSRSKPSDVEACIEFLLSHWTSDGGFAWYANGPADLLATYYALDTLDRLDALGRLHEYQRLSGRPTEALPDDLEVVSLQLNAPGQGSPAELVRLADSLKIQHWITREGMDGYRDELMRIASRQNVPVVIDRAQEDYAYFHNVPGIGRYGRTSLLLIPSTETEMPRPIDHPDLWTDYRAMRVKDLRARDAMMVWNVCDNEVFARSVLDDSMTLGGFDLINVFHFGGWDLLVNFPWLRAYEGRIPFVAINDTQGAQAWWWADQLASSRTLYLGKRASWSDWREAVRRNWVVAVRLDQHTKEPRIYGGTKAVRRHVLDKIDEWRWWRNGGSTTRPVVSLVAVQPDDQFEGPPVEQGVVLRVRTWWTSDASGYPKEQRSELISLRLDGEVVVPKLVEHRNIKQRVVDQYYRCELPKIAGGRHLASAEVRLLESGQRYTQSIEFEVP